MNSSSSISPFAKRIFKSIGCGVVRRARARRGTDVRVMVRLRVVEVTDDEIRDRADEQ